jgi:hypothetical protein
MPAANGAPPSKSSSDASLSGLTVSIGSFDASFRPATFTYTQTTNAAALNAIPSVSVANATVAVNAVTIASAPASYQIDAALGSNTITVAPTGENGDVGPLH